MVLHDVETLVSDLEKMELEALTSPPPDAYARLLAIYLYQNDLCNAKFLWKRIPTTTKLDHPELTKIWNVGKRMWQRDWPGVHAALVAEWSDNVGSIMQALKESVQERALTLIADAYSSIDISVVGSMTGLHETEQVRELVTQRGWTIDDSTVRPCKNDKEQANQPHASLTEDQLYKLTQFVSFLEN